VGAFRAGGGDMVIRIALAAVLAGLALSADAALLMRSAGGIFGPRPHLDNCILLSGTTTNCLLVGASTNPLLVR